MHVRATRRGQGPRGGEHHRNASFGNACGTGERRTANAGWGISECRCARRGELADAKQTLQEFLKGRNPAWHLVGRVHFNLAENRSDEEAPFAFIATYTTRLSAQSRAQHLPLVEALREYAGAKNKARLLASKAGTGGRKRMRMAHCHGG